MSLLFKGHTFTILRVSLFVIRPFVLPVLKRMRVVVGVCGVLRWLDFGADMENY